MKGERKPVLWRGQPVEALGRDGLLQAVRELAAEVEKHNALRRWEWEVLAALSDARAKVAA